MNIKRITTLVFVLAIAALIVGLSACENSIDVIVTILSGEDTSESMGVSGEIPIGVVVALTGRFASEVGIPMQRGFELARQEINNAQLGDARITFITEDDRSENAVEAFNKLIHQDGVPAIIGLAISTQAKVAFPIAEKYQVVAFSSVSSASGLSAIGDFIFRAGLTTDVLLPLGIKATHAKLGYQRVATIYDEIDVYSTDS